MIDQISKLFAITKIRFFSNYVKARGQLQGCLTLLGSHLWLSLAQPHLAAGWLGLCSLFYHTQTKGAALPGTCCSLMAKERNKELKLQTFLKLLLVNSMYHICSHAIDQGGSVSPISHDKRITQRRLASHCKPMRRSSVGPLSRLMHVPRRLKDSSGRLWSEKLRRWL